MILVMGGTGYIGSRLVDRLASVSYPVRIFGRKRPDHSGSAGTWWKSVEICTGDLRDEAAVSRAMSGVDIVYHLGAISPQGSGVEQMRHPFDVNVMGTFNVLMGALEAGCRRVIFASSAAVYGDSEVSPQREDMPVAPRSAYAVSKVTGEHLCQLFHHQHGLETVTLRYFNVYGPGQQTPFVVPRFVSALRSGARITLHGGGDQTRDFIYIDDVVTATIQAATAPDAAGKVINIGSGKPVTVKQLLAELAAILDMTPEIDSVPAPLDDIKESIADITVAREVLHYEPAFSFREGLRRSVGPVATPIANK